MKELTEHEVLAIAGGLPSAAALDEISYRAPAEALHDPMACAGRAAGERPEAKSD